MLKSHDNFFWTILFIILGWLFFFYNFNNQVNNQENQLKKMNRKAILNAKRLTAKNNRAANDISKLWPFSGGRTITKNGVKTVLLHQGFGNFEQAKMGIFDGSRILSLKALTETNAVIKFSPDYPTMSKPDDELFIELDEITNLQNYNVVTKHIDGSVVIHSGYFTWRDTKEQAEMFNDLIKENVDISYDSDAEDDPLDLYMFNRAYVFGTKRENIIAKNKDRTSENPLDVKSVGYDRLYISKSYEYHRRVKMDEKALAFEKHIMESD